MTDKLKRTAYFCMEFGLHEDFKIYSGGLGILAGDLLKAAKDEKVPMIGVGILWRQGYTTQLIGDDGKPYDCYPEYRYDFLEDCNIEVEVEIRERIVKCKVWKCNKYGNADLYLLDTNIPGNNDLHITGQLYGWFSEERIAQEMVLGIGGIRALKALGIDVDIYHFNDSHPVIAGIELITQKIKEDKISFEKAWQQVREKIVFTTHTPVKEGNELHEHALLKYMGAYNGLTYEQMVELGGDPFSMTAAGLRLSKKANAVAQLHCETAKKMWKNIDGASEIIAITNGVHNGTWQESRIVNAKENKNALWKAHMEVKAEMLEEIYKRNGIKLKHDVLTIGFARRAATYKRGDLIFRNKDIIEPLLEQGKIQIILSGKAHPNELIGKGIVANLFAMSKKHPDSIVFIQNYDISIGRILTRGCDIWLNNPIRPMEACGTSGMKAAMNGVLNFSVLDGWWPEGCIHGVNGWQIGDGYEGPDCEEVDSKSLYKTLLDEIIPTYYENRNKWVEMMQSSINMASEKFSAVRMLRDYYNLMY